MTTLRDDKKFWGLGEVLSLSWPAALSMLTPTAMRFIDGVMVSQLGPETSGAQMFAGISAFVPESFALGVLTVVNTYVAQNFGANRLGRCGQYAWAGILVALGFCMLIAPLALVARPLFGLFGHSTFIQQQEVLYFRYMVLSVFLTLLSRPFQQFFYGLQRPGIVLAATIVAGVCNIIGDYALIFGKFGLPALGLEGAAIATLISWGLMLAILAAVFFTRRMHQHYQTRHPGAVRWRHCRELLCIGWPAGVQFLNDVLPWTIFTGGIMSIFGKTHFIAGTVVMRWLPLSFMPAVGVGVAATALVGKYIGAGRPDLARRRVHMALATAAVYMGLCALGFLIFRHPMVSLFVNLPGGTGDDAVSPQQIRQIIDIGGALMICAAIFQLGDAVGIVFIGALRGAGDTLFPMIATIMLSWSVIIGGGYAMAHIFPGLTSVGPWLAASIYIAILGSLMAWRFEHGAWRRIDLLGRRLPMPPQPEPAVYPDTPTTAASFEQTNDE